MLHPIFTVMTILVFCLVNMVFQDTRGESSAQSEQKTYYQLRNQFQQNEEQYLHLDTTLKGSSQVGDDHLPINVDMDMLFVFRTREVKQDGREAVVEVDIEQLEMMDEMMGPKKINVLEMLGNQGQPYSVKVNQSGEAEKLVDTKLPNVAIPGMEQANVMRMPWLKLPDQQVAIGDSWTDAQNIPLEGLSEPMINHATYTLVDVEERGGEQIAHIKKVNRISAENVIYNPEPVQQGMGKVTVNVVFQQYKAQGEGMLEFNISRGQLVTLQDQIDYLIDMGGETNVDQAGFPNTYVMKFTVMLDGKFSRESN
ncbi:MAG: hypothetical protein ACOX5R_15395 [bacterium]|jgi:hypothetical protein